jgi:hypothetical protein
MKFGSLLEHIQSFLRQFTSLGSICTHNESNLQIYIIYRISMSLWIPYLAASVSIDEESDEMAMEAMCQNFINFGFFLMKFTPNFIKKNGIYEFFL